MNLLVTGTAGFLGSRIASYYSTYHTVLALTHSDLDITDPVQVTETIRAFSPDVVIHCAAISDVSACAKSPELSMAVNVAGTRNLAKASEEIGARFVFCSSDQVYFNEQPVETLIPHTETEPLAPLPLYGRHKLLAEQACMEEQPDSVILRLTWMYDRLSPEEIAGGKGNFLTMLAHALQTGETLSFSATDHRGITNVQDVVRQLDKVWQLPAGIYNYGSSNHQNMSETARRVLQAFGKSELLQTTEGGRLRNLTMDNSRAESFGIHFPDTVLGVIDALKQ